MKKILQILILIALLSSCKQEVQPGKIKTSTGFALGTTYNIQYEVDNDTIDYTDDIEKVFNVVNKSMSTYLPTSDITRINRGDSTLVVDEHFKKVFNFSEDVWKKTKGYFDPTVGALVDAWGFGPNKAINVTPVRIDSILKFTGFDKVELTSKGTVHKKHPSLALDFNALAKGYTIDLVGQMLDGKGVENYLIELGGEILTKGQNSKTVKKWVVAIESPVQKENERILIKKVQLEDKAMATSGNYRKFRIDENTGEYYVHTINPLSGRPLKSNVLSVSVVANTCMEADAYATAFMVMNLNDSKKLLKELNDVEAFIMIVDKEGDLQNFTTRGFQELLVD